MLSGDVWVSSFISHSTRSPNITSVTHSRTTVWVCVCRFAYTACRLEFLEVLGSVQLVCVLWVSVCVKGVTGGVCKCVCEIVRVSVWRVLLVGFVSVCVSCQKQLSTQVMPDWYPERLRLSLHAHQHYFPISPKMPFSSPRLRMWLKS